MIVHDTFKHRACECIACKEPQKPICWLKEPLPPCTFCGGNLMLVEATFFGQAAAVHGDEIDIVHEHGVCHADGTPRRFRSRAELRAAEAAAGVRRLERGEKFAGDERAKAKEAARKHRSV